MSDFPDRTAAEWAALVAKELKGRPPDELVWRTPEGIAVKIGAQGAGDVLVVCGGVVPPQDHAELIAAGVGAIYGPGTNIPAAAIEILGLIHQRRSAAA